MLLRCRCAGPSRSVASLFRRVSGWIGWFRAWIPNTAPRRSGIRAAVGFRACRYFPEVNRFLFREGGKPGPARSACPFLPIPSVPDSRDYPTHTPKPTQLVGRGGAMQYVCGQASGVFAASAETGVVAGAKTANRRGAGPTYRALNRAATGSRFPRGTVRRTSSIGVPRGR